SGVRRRIQRSFLSSSACGVCGATTIESRALDFERLPPGPQVDPTVLGSLPERLREKQRLVEQTGGLQAPRWFDTLWHRVTRRGDEGGRKGVDRGVGRARRDGRLPLTEQVLVVRGRGG